MSEHYLRGIKVKDLIAKLSEYGPDMEVWIAKTGKVGFTPNIHLTPEIVIVPHPEGVRLVLTINPLIK